MKRILIISLIVFSISCDKVTDDIDKVDYQTKLQVLIDQKWEDFTAEKINYPGGYSMQVMHGDDEYYVASGGLESTDNQIHFRAASTTKTFTAAGILLLYQQGHLNINDCLTDTIPGMAITYLPDTDDFDIPYKNEITIKQLLQNRAGVFDLINSVIPEKVAAAYAGKLYIDYVLEDLGDATHTFTTAEMVGLLAEHQLCYFKPGEEFHYSDTGFNLLGYIIERVSGENYSDFITENLLIPNGLNETTFPNTGTDRNLPEDYAPGYAYYMGDTLDLTISNHSQNQAEGNVVTTPYDLTKWIKLLLAGEAGVDRKYIQFLMMDCQPTYESHQYYGLGCVFTPGLGYGHNGATACYFTVARYDPDLDMAFTVFTNVWDYELILNDLYIQVYDMYDLLLEAKEIVTE